MSLTVPDDKKKLIEKEVKALEEKLVVVAQFEEKVGKIDEFCNSLKNFDGSLKSIDTWMRGATKELDDIKNSSDKMAPEDRVARTMDLQEDIAAKVEIIKKNQENELALLPQGSVLNSEY
jgi:archaellum component FlaC